MSGQSGSFLDRQKSSYYIDKMKISIKQITLKQNPKILVHGIVAKTEALTITKRKRSKLWLTTIYLI
jgi:hypothetical protein